MRQRVDRRIGGERTPAFRRGCRSSLECVEHVLEAGYDVTGRITGAQFQRKMPLALDGIRPRLVEQELRTSGERLEVAVRPTLGPWACREVGRFD